jgi:hypothetical protein
MRFAIDAPDPRATNPDPVLLKEVKRARRCFDALVSLERHEPPADHIQAALASPGIIADHRKRVRRGHIPTRRDDASITPRDRGKKEMDGAIASARFWC